MSMRVEKFNNRQQVPTSFGDDFKDNVLKFLIDNETGYTLDLKDISGSTDKKLSLISKTGKILGSVDIKQEEVVQLDTIELQYTNKRIVFTFTDGSKKYCDITDIVEEDAKKLDKITTTTDYDRAYVKPATPTAQTPTVMVDIRGGDINAGGAGGTLVKRDDAGRIQGSVFSKNVYNAETMNDAANIQFTDSNNIILTASSDDATSRPTIKLGSLDDSTKGVYIYPGPPEDGDSNEDVVYKIKLDGKTIINKTTFTDNDEVVNKQYIDAADTQLSTRIDNLSAVGRFLSSWNCSTGKPADYPSVPVGAEYPFTYTYKTGDYYIIGTIPESGTKYRPNGSSITKQTAESEWTVRTETETNTVAVGDFYFYTTNGWIWLSNEQKITTFSAVAGDAKYNTSLADYLNNTATVSYANTETYVATATVDTDGVLHLNSGAFTNSNVVKYKEGPTVTRIRQN